MSKSNLGIVGIGLNLGPGTALAQPANAAKVAHFVVADLVGVLIALSPKIRIDHDVLVTLSFFG